MYKGVYREGSGFKCLILFKLFYLCSMTTNRLSPSMTRRLRLWGRSALIFYPSNLKPSPLTLLLPSVTSASRGSTSTSFRCLTLLSLSRHSPPCTSRGSTTCTSTACALPCLSPASSQLLWGISPPTLPASPLRRSLPPARHLPLPPPLVVISRTPSLDSTWRGYKTCCSTPATTATTSTWTASQSLIG